MLAGNFENIGEKKEIWFYKIPFTISHHRDERIVWRKEQIDKMELLSR